ncbi:MAG: hypothetical protein ACTSRZ_06660 [Promethearchaeota archaeon]
MDDFSEKSLDNTQTNEEYSNNNLKTPKDNSNNTYPQIKDINNTAKNLWNVIGIHRSIASFWYQFILLLIVLIPAVLIYGFVIPNYILPYPESLGYNSLTTGTFALFFTIMDVATQPACERFVAQYAEINPRKALKYIQFFIYFQMFTGLIQVTAVSLYVWLYLRKTNLIYAAWFFLLYSTTQYPGMLGAYKSSLKGYQRFDRSNIVEIIQGVLFENITQIIFILLGRYFGRLNPAVGELIGATLGYIIGKYIDDFFALILSAYYMAQILKPYNIRLVETIIPGFSLEEAKQSLSYGIKLLGSSLISTLTDYITLQMMIIWVPNYISILGYIEIAKTIANYVTTHYNFSALMSEAYNNGKKKLTQYIIERYFQHWLYLAFFLTIEISIMIPPILEYFGGDWGRAAWIIPIYVIPRLMVVPPVMGAEILQACDKPMYRTYGIISEKITKMLCVFLFLSPSGLASVFGENAIIILYALHDIPAYIVITLTEFLLIHYKIVPVKINIWQTFIAGPIASLPVIPINLAMLKILNIVWNNSTSLTIPFSLVGIYLFILLFIFPMIMFFIYGLLGGWDETAIEEFKNAIELSGPSKFIVKIYFKLTKKGHDISPIRNKFATPSKEAYEEIKELNALLALR